MTAGPYFVELLDRTDAILHRVRVDRLPIRIGRGYDNEVIVDDPYMAATHVVIDTDEHGALAASDAGTSNGIHETHHGRFWLRAGTRHSAIALNGETVIRAGHTILRVRVADHAIQPERPDTTSHAWEGAAPALVGIALLGAIALFDAWLTNSSEQVSTHYASHFGLVFGCVMAWAGLWSLLNRLFSGRARFGRHLLIAAAVLFGIEMAAQLIQQSAYTFSLSWLSRYQTYIVYGLIAIAVYLHMATLRPLAPTLARIVAIAFLVLTTGLLALVRYSSHQTVEYAAYEEALRWPASRLAGTLPSETFVKRAAGLTARADTRRGDAPASDEEDE